MVRTYAGIDPETGKRRYLTETCRSRAGAARVRRVAQVDCGKGRADKLGSGDAVRLWLASRDERVEAGDLSEGSQYHSRHSPNTT